MGLGRVLVVDDEKHVRETVRAMLTKAGYDVVLADDGDTGIQAMKSDDNPLMVDVIICDIHMPKIKGTDAIKYFRSQFPSVPVIVLTGKPEPEGITGFLKQGVVDYLVKPVKAAALVTAVSQAHKEHSRKINSSA
ncbi:MAG TPA: response regulator [Nitrospira sp.]|nr:response regulator [Nitrospira sp.]